MAERVYQYLALYRKHRFEHQRSFYESRQKEFEAAHDEVIWLTAGFMILTAGAAAFASADVWGLHTLWLILSVAFPAFSTALSAYNGLYAFERQAKVYGDAANALLRARADSPELKPPMEDAAFADAVGAHVLQIERILSDEQAQWGQLIGEIKPISPPSAQPDQQTAPGT
ncbi:MAG: SLATT domain-containing protein [Verrucomicrobia bacterium]|nr:SLATT domain-containing protein [Verrucomicrobiota bacterium]MBV9673538.1 SLATT domain-containing protein [Verrucomicrobiota bacterium]